MSGDITILYVTCRDSSEARTISKELLGKKLVACANMLPIESMYFWENNLNEDKEIILLLKTTKEKTDAAVKEIKNLHSYDIPCILRFTAGANLEYLQWVEDQTRT